MASRRERLCPGASELVFVLVPISRNRFSWLENPRHRAKPPTLPTLLDLVYTTEDTEITEVNA